MNIKKMKEYRFLKPILHLFSRNIIFCWTGSRSISSRIWPTSSFSCRCPEEQIYVSYSQHRMTSAIFNNRDPSTVGFGLWRKERNLLCPVQKTIRQPIRHGMQQICSYFWYKNWRMGIDQDIGLSSKDEQAGRTQLNDAVNSGTPMEVQSDSYPGNGWVYCCCNLQLSLVF